MSATDVADLIAAECDAIKAMLLAKNAAYGNSALEPLRIASRASTVEQILVRIDDKLSRLARGDGSGNEDVWADLLGYIVLLRVARNLPSATDRAGRSLPASSTPPLHPTQAPGPAGAPPHGGR